MLPSDQDEFVARLLHSMRFILSNPGELEHAILVYTEGKNEDTRYQSHSLITNGNAWTPNECLSFKAAYSEALVIVSTIFMNSDPRFGSKESFQFIEYIKEKILPKITQNVKEKDRLRSVIDNIHTLLRTTYLKYPEPDECKKVPLPSSKNPFGFFTHPVTIGVAVTAATIGFALVLGSSSRE